MDIVKNQYSAAKNALITGSSKRIGSAIAKSLAKRGTNIIVHHFSSHTDAEALCAEIREMGVKAEPISADLSNPSETRRLFKEAIEKFGAIDLVVNNASIFEPDSVLELDDALWAAHFSVHLQAPAILASEMAKQSDLKDGLIVNMIDQRVKNLNPMFFSYLD